MTRPTKMPNGWFTMVLVVLVGAACERADDRSRADSPGAGGDTMPVAFLECDSSRVVSEASRSDILSWASGLTFQPADSSRGYVVGLEPTATGSMRVEAAGDARRRPRATLRRGCIIGRIVSSRVDTSLGLAAGTNYVWADSGGSGWRATVIPEPPSAAVRSFRMAIHDHRASQVPPTTLATTRAPCLECEIAGWCRWPMDTIKTAAIRPGRRDPITGREALSPR